MKIMKEEKGYNPSRWFRYAASWLSLVCTGQQWLKTFERGSSVRSRPPRCHHHNPTHCRTLIPAQRNGCRVVAMANSYQIRPHQ